MSGLERALTNEALADRLRRITADPRRWPKVERDALVLEAARRLEVKPKQANCGHARYRESGGCGEMGCANYAGKNRR